MPKKKKKNVNKANKKTVGQYGSEQDEDDYEAGSDEEWFSRSDGVDSDGEPKKGKKVSVFCQTKYQAVKEAGKVFNEYHFQEKKFNRKSYEFIEKDRIRMGYSLV